MNAELIIPKDIDIDTRVTTGSDNVIPFQPLPGGKDPTNNWLEALPQGTVFTCKPRAMQKGALDVFTLEYHVCFKTVLETKLFENLNDERYFWVITKNFSRAFEQVEILAQPQE